MSLAHPVLIQACLDSARDALVVIDDVGKVVYWNPAAENLFGYSAKQVAGKLLRALIIGDTEQQALPCLARRGWDELQNKRIDITARHRSGESFPAEFTLSTYQLDEQWYSVALICDARQQSHYRIVLERIAAIRALPFDQAKLNQVLQQAVRLIATLPEQRLQAAILVSDTNKTPQLRAHYGLDDHQRFQISERVVSIWQQLQAAIESSCVDLDTHWHAIPLRNHKGRLKGALLFTHINQPHDPVSHETLQQLASALAQLLDRAMLFRQNERLRQIVEQNPAPIAITNRLGEFEYVNPRFCSVTGYTQQELLGNTPRLIKSGHTPRALYEDLWHTILSGKAWRGEIQNRRKSGELFWEAQLIWPINEDDEVVAFVALKEDITERKHFEQQLQQLATYDSLTGLPNKALLNDRITHALEQSARNGKAMLACLVDIRQMALINESVGLSGGDAVLKAFAERLQETFRRADTVARLSSDAFVILCCTDKPALVEERLQTLEDMRITTPLMELNLGIYSSLAPMAAGDNPELLLNKLTAALHHAKAVDSRKPVLYDPSMGEAAWQQITLQQDLKQALEKNQFELWYQPKVELASGQVIGAEALIRWQHPERGLLGPFLFIGIAETSGLIIEIGRWVIRETIRQQAEWFSRGIKIPVSLNLSVRQLNDTELIKTIRTALAAHQLPPSLIEIELTESMLAQDQQQVSNLLTQLHELGTGLSLDDYGSGYSSLAYLHRLPFDTLKMDRTFVNGVDSEPSDAVIVRSTLSMATGLGLKVIAEGVETDAQARFLLRNGCHQVQGFLFSKPLPAKQIPDVVAKGFSAIKLEDLAEEWVLILDDERPVLHALQRELHSRYRVFCAETPEEAYSALAQHPIGVVISDQRMQGILGTEFLHQVKRLHPQTSRILLTGLSDFETVNRAINEGDVLRYLTKPWDNKQLLDTLAEGFRYYHLNRSLEQKRQQLERMQQSCYLSESIGEAQDPHCDQQHREMINLHNRLVDAYFDHAPTERIRGLFQQLTALCAIHFHDEEAVMAARDYPELDSHKAEHLHLIEQIAEFGRRLASDYHGVNLYELICFVKRCVSDHIEDFDAAFEQWQIKN